MITSLIEQLSVYQTFVDTCAFMNDGFQKSVFYSIDKMKEKGYILYTFPIVKSELLHISRNPSQKESDKEKAKNALIIISILESLGLMKTININTNNFRVTADHIFLLYFIKYSSSRKLQLITQDKMLSDNLMNINSMNTVNAKGIRVSRFDNSNLVV